MLDTVKINHVQHISFTQPRLTDAVSVILRELLSYEHPSKERGIFDQLCGFQSRWEWRFMEWFSLPITSRTTTIHTMAMARLITTF